MTSKDMVRFSRQWYKQWFSGAIDRHIVVKDCLVEHLKEIYGTDPLDLLGARSDLERLLCGGRCVTKTGRGAFAYVCDGLRLSHSQRDAIRHRLLLGNSADFDPAILGKAEPEKEGETA